MPLAGIRPAVSYVPDDAAAGRNHAIDTACTILAASVRVAALRVARSLGDTVSPLVLSSLFLAWSAPRSKGVVAVESGEGLGARAGAT